jgi:diaminohydroxyphosphoribosylaminopyrimidine deaminase/5-amino-6-(5-phosphoribosylamino)uracil reductase
VADSGVRHVVAAQRDPFSEVRGRGIAELQAAGVTVEVGLLEAEARRLNAPYLKLVGTGRPWVMAKWAMTLDGKIATRTGESRWISGAASREVVHKLRGRVDAIVVGRETAARDDPLLTARPPGPRTAIRVVLDTHGSLANESRLVQSARDVPVLVAIGESAPAAARQRLEAAGCQVFVSGGPTPAARLDALLAELGRRRLTNVLVEGGSRLLGSLLEARQIDEVHVFLAPKLFGGESAPAAIGGAGIAHLSGALDLGPPTVERLGEDTYIHARVRR